MIKEIKFTDKAIKQINNLLSKKDKGSFFRIAIKGGGCSGFQYDFSFDQNPKDEDLKFNNIINLKRCLYNEKLYLYILYSILFFSGIC